jgi:hypothetical protein
VAFHDHEDKGGSRQSASLAMNPMLELEVDGTREDRGQSRRFARSIDASAAFLEAHPWAIFAVIALLYLIYLYLAIGVAKPPLWHDELFTYYIAQAPTFGQMLQQTRTVDLNPPLYYIIARFVFKFLPPDSFSVRLPSMVAFLLAASFLYSFVRRRLSPIYGFLSAVVLLGSMYANYAHEARPYALVLAFLGVAAAGWQRATEQGSRTSWLGMLLLVMGGFGMLLSHVLALIAYGAFFFAEAVRFCIRRKSDWLLWVCLFLPLTTVALYAPLLRSHAAGAFPSEFQASLSRLSDNYVAIWTSLGPLLAAAMVAIILLGRQEGASSATARGSGFSGAEWSFAAYLLFVPLIVAVIFIRSHSAYFDRYGMPAVFGASILVPGLIAGWTRTNRVAALLAAGVFAFGLVLPIAFATYEQQIIHRPEDDNPDLTGYSLTSLDEVEKSLPFVDASGLTFLEMDSREDKDFLSRVYYLTDTQAAMQYSHATIFESFGALKSVFPIRANIMPYRQFVRLHPKFLVFGTVDYPEDWLLRKLLADGATMRYLGDFATSYKDSTLYEITLPQQ